jgi:hypothetical protein
MGLRAGLEDQETVVEGVVAGVCVLNAELGRVLPLSVGGVRAVS